MTERPGTARTCGTCEHWAGTDHWMADGEFRACTFIPMTGDNDFSPRAPADETPAGRMRRLYPEAHAFTADASQYKSALMCDRDFGCVHWEAI